MPFSIPKGMPRLSRTRPIIVPCLLTNELLGKCGGLDRWAGIRYHFFGGHRMNRRIVRLFLFVVVAMFAASATLSLAKNKPTNSVDELDKALGMTKPAMTQAPDFTLSDVGGATVSLSGQRDRLVLLNFWA